MSLRLFAALSPPEEVAAPIAGMQRGIGGAAWTPAENLHLTLRFFGGVTEPQADELDAELGVVAAAPFEIRLKGAGFFGNAEPHSLWLGVAPCAPLSALAQAAERAARRVGLPPEKRKFTPHVTIAALRNPELDRVMAFVRQHALYEGAPWSVESFGLYSSQVRRGASSLYRLEAEYPLMHRGGRNA